MAYKLKFSEADIDKKEYVNAKGDTECVELVRQTTGAPQTTKWVKGVNVMESAAGSIAKGTGIATFDDKGKYYGHGAIYVSHSKSGIVVYDQWVNRDKDKVKIANKATSSRTIKSRAENKTGRLQNIAENYYVID